MFNRLRQMRPIAFCYDKTALSFMSFLNLVSVRLWISSFVNVASSYRDIVIKVQKNELK
ncbi:putative transposase [Gluconobacter morbifer G707]|uniref:Putative transposase n=1 Tax=Gluconobacter morbifer G707 TaxID=1088869 RepID=G6XHF7_9PROT|nr:putative transposase [Gluconobacter morbifer G707]